MEIMDASIVGLITSAVCIFLLWKFLSCAVFPLLGNIILGGLLYYVINLLHIVHMPWSFFDIVVIAIFGIPGTVFLAIFHFSSNNRSRYEKSYPLSEDTIFLLQDSATFYFVNNFIQPRALPFILGNIFT